VTTPYSRLHDSTDHDFDDLSGETRFCLNDCTATAELAALPRLTPGVVYLALTGNTAGATYSIQAVNGAPCLAGDWVTTLWTISTTEGSTSGGAGIHYTVTATQAVLDFTGMAPLGDLTFSGTVTEDLSYPQSTTATSGTISVEELPGGDLTLSVAGGPPMPANYADSPVHGGAGTWTCSASTMTWHLENGTGHIELDFMRLP